MKCVRTLCLATAALLAAATGLPGVEPQPPVRVLLLTGQNNHNWKETTPALKRILTACRRFTVEVTEHPEQCPPETLRGCDAVLSNWNALGPVKAWPEPFRNAALPTFQALLLRGTEWAATGRVTIASATAMAADPDELLQAIAGYKFGDSRSDVVALEKYVGAATRDAAASRALAAKLAAYDSRSGDPRPAEVGTWIPTGDETCLNQEYTSIGGGF